MHKILLNDGRSIPQLGLGVFQTRDGEETANAVYWALEAGYRHIDTAKIYANERGVGEGMRKSGLARGEIYLTTKLWNEDIRKGRAREALAESLEMLGTDYVDLYLIHWPAVGYEKAWMELLQAEGKIRTIGVSNFHEHHLDSLARTAKVVPAVNQIEAHPYFNNQKLIDLCAARGIAVQVWSPLGGTGGNLLQDAVLAGIAVKYGRTPAQIVLRWDLQRGVIVLPKSVHRERIASNGEIFDFELSREDMERINALERGERVGANPDTFDF